MTALRLAALVVALALLAAGCGGGGNGDEEEAATTAVTGGTTTEGVPIAVDGGAASDEPGDILLRFVKAAGRGDADAMWELLTAPTQASIGPTLEDFRADTAINLEAGLGSIAKDAKVILSRKLPDDWGVAAVAGDRVVDGKPEHYSYGAALLPEDGKLKLELGGVVIAGYKPDPLSTIDDPKPLVAANVGAGGDLTELRMWLDGKPFPARRGAEDTPFTATLRGHPAQPLKPGLHEVVVFAATNDTATASAWPFTVEP